MKKILIPALLVASAAFTPGLRNAVEIPDRACEVAQTVAAPLFWHLWNELLDLETRAVDAAGREWRRSIGMASQDCQTTRSSAYSFTFFSSMHSTGAVGCGEK